jgi:hypothetical protein
MSHLVAAVPDIVADFVVPASAVAGDSATKIIDIAAARKTRGLIFITHVHLFSLLA